MKTVSLATITFLGLITGSLAADIGDTPQLFVGVGAFDVDKSHPKAQMQLEYRFGVNVANVRPLVGGFTTQKGSTFVYAGAAWDYFIAEKFAITPSFAPGVYYKGWGKDLGFPVEFRSSIEVSYIADNESRFGTQFYHISNASMGNKNPGEESLIFFYSIPLTSILPSFR